MILSTWPERLLILSPSTLINLKPRTYKNRKTYSYAPFDGKTIDYVKKPKHKFTNVTDQILKLCGKKVIVSIKWKKQAWMLENVNIRKCEHRLLSYCMIHILFIACFINKWEKVDERILIKIILTHSRDNPACKILKVRARDFVVSYKWG